MLAGRVGEASNKESVGIKGLEDGPISSEPEGRDTIFKSILSI